MIDVPDAILDQINDTCDQFERLAQQDEWPRIESFLQEFPDPFRFHLLQWMIPIEMELLQAKVGENEKWAKTVESYVSRFPDLADPSAAACLESIVIAEFRLRQVTNDPPDIRSTLLRFPSMRSSLAEKLRMELYQIRPIVIKVGVGSRDELAISIDKVVQLGRQRSDEPPPIKLCKIDEATSRLIIASGQETMVSRQHATCELVALGQVAIRNHSRRSLVAINAEERVAPHQLWTGEPPFLLHVGPKVFHVEAL